MALELPTVSVDGSTSQSLCKGAAKIICLIKTEWKEEDLLYKVYSDGITNKIVGVYHKEGSKNDQMLVRVYGLKTELFIDRQAEKNYVKYLQPYGCGPTLYASFSNGICYSFVPGEPLSTTIVATEPVYRAVAQHMAKLNSIKSPSESSRPMLFNKLKTFQSLLPDDFTVTDKLKNVVAASYTKKLLVDAAAELQPIVTGLQCPLMLSHNDLLLGNIIWQQEKKSINFIDFEYTETNYLPYDVANHFCEFAGVDTVDYNLYPSEDFQREWLTVYLSHLSTPSPHPLDWWVGAVAVLALCSHLFWGTWALVQAQHSTIDFDFAEYALIRLNEYKRRKSDFLKLGEKSTLIVESSQKR